MDNPLNATIDVLDSLGVFKGVDFIEDLAASWVDALVDRRGEFISEPVRRYVADLRHTILDRFPPAEAHWRVIFLQFHMRMLAVHIDLEADYPPRQPSGRIYTTEDIAAHTQPVIRYLTSLPIREAADWFQALVYECVTGLELDILQAAEEQGEGRDAFRKGNYLRYYPVKLLADMTEA